MQEMPIPKPNLDDTTFEEIVEEAKKKIPVYSRLWTDFNQSDPGITFIELFAWLVDMQIYSLNRITGKNYQKYLNLLGVRRLVARPPKVFVTFISDIMDEFIPIEKLTKIKLDATNEYKNIFLETDEDTILAPLRIKKVETH